MRSVLLAIVVLGLVGCNGQIVTSTFEAVGTELASATSIAPSPSPELSSPGSVTVTFRLTLTGPVPDDAAFALQTVIVGAGIVGNGGANYLCSYYGGYPVCAAGETFEESHDFAPGTQVSYRFWRELDVDGATEEIEASEVTVGSTDQVISVSYAFQP
jgi:hypothetical protein